MGDLTILLVAGLSAVTGLLVWAGSNGRMDRLWIVTGFIATGAVAWMFVSAGNEEAGHFRISLALAVAPLLLMSGVIHMGHLVGAPKWASAIVAIATGFLAALAALLWALQEATWVIF